MSERRGPLFVGRVSYRQRRLADAARLLPVFGAILMALPLLWPRAEDAGAPPTSVAIIYIFGSWTLLTIVAGLLSRWLDPGIAEADTRDDTSTGESDRSQGG